MQREINDLKRKLRHAQRRRSHSSPDIPSDDESDNDYRQRSRTPPSETFSHEERHYRRRKRKSPSPKGLGNDAMSSALDQLSKSPFTRHIEGATLPRWFQQPALTLYNGNTNPVEHVSQFSWKIHFHSIRKNSLCKILKNEPKKQYLNTVTKFCPSIIMLLTPLVWKSIKNLKLLQIYYY